MRNLLLVCCALIASTALVGCRVAGEVDPDGSVSYDHVAPC